MVRSNGSRRDGESDAVSGAAAGLAGPGVRVRTAGRMARRAGAGGNAAIRPAHRQHAAGPGRRARRGGRDRARSRPRQGHPLRRLPQLGDGRARLRFAAGRHRRRRPRGRRRLAGGIDALSGGRHAEGRAADRRPGRPRGCGELHRQQQPSRAWRPGRGARLQARARRGALRQHRQRHHLHREHRARSIVRRWRCVARGDERGCPRRDAGRPAARQERAGAAVSGDADPDQPPPGLDRLARTRGIRTGAGSS